MKDLNKSGVIAVKTKVAEDTYKIDITLDNAETLDYQAGQFVSIKIADKINRSYSIGCKPGDRYLSLIADATHGGPGSKFFAECKEGDKINIMGPLGRSVYHDGDNPVFFFSTGTGVVPHMAMIRYALETLHSSRQITLISGFRYESSIILDEYFTDLANTYPNFKYIATLTKPEDSWTRGKGRVYEHFNLIDTPVKASAYICGSRVMVTDVEEKLLELGLVKENIHFEKY